MREQRRKESSSSRILEFIEIIRILAINVESIAELEKSPFGKCHSNYCFAESLVGTKISKQK